MRGGRGLCSSHSHPSARGTEAGDSGGEGLGVQVGALTAVGRLLVRLVLAVGDAVACQAKIDALAVGTLKLVLCTARGIHRWGERQGGPCMFRGVTLRAMGIYFRVLYESDVFRYSS